MEKIFEIPEIIGNKTAKSKPEKTIAEHTMDLAKEAERLLDYGYIKSTEYKKIHQLLLLACKYHDYGKVGKYFQDRMKTNGKFQSDVEIPHNILSLLFINPDSEEFADEDFYKVAYAVLNHHKYGEERTIIAERREDILNNIEEFNNYIYPDNLKRRKMDQIYEYAENPEVILLKGYLHRCDYSASAGFPVEYPNDFLTDKLIKTMENWRKKSSDAHWNKMQEYVIKNQNKNIILTAQTGMGKTEAGLLWIGDTKGFFILPLRTAINAMYKRIREEILGSDSKIEEQLGLLHSETLEKYDEIENGDIDIFTYRDKTRKLCMPLTISTLDQLFDFVFKYSGYEMKLTTLAYSKIVIDEIQMYSAELLAYLIWGCKMVHDLGGRLMIMTATLAPFIKDLLMQYVFSKKDVVVLSFADEDKIRHNVKVIQEKIRAADICEKFYDNSGIGKSNKILVVCNTVKKAQKIYRDLEDMGIDTNVLHIFHNKFLKKDKKDLEEQILAFGKTYEDNNHKKVMNGTGIWISTSMVEASLDIDFDYLFTELMDLNSFFQRLGRVNRKGIKAVDEYNCFVYTRIDENILQRGECGFVDETMYQLSKEALEKFDGKMSELKKLKMLDETFTTEKVLQCSYMEKVNRTLAFLQYIRVDEFKKEESCLRNIFSYTIIPRNTYDENKQEIETFAEELKKKNDYKSKWNALKKLQGYTLEIEPYYYRKLISRDDIVFKVKGMDEIHILNCEYGKLGFEPERSKTENSGIMW